MTIARLGTTTFNPDLLPDKLEKSRNFSPSSPSEAIHANPYLAKNPEITQSEVLQLRQKRIQAFLERRRQLPSSVDRGTMNKMPIPKKVIGTISPQMAHLQATITDMANQNVSQIALMRGRLIISAQKREKALAEVEEHLERVTSQSHLLLSSVREGIHSVHQKIQEIGVLQERFDSLMGKTFQNYAHLEQQINQELLIQRDIQKRVHDLEEGVVKTQRELSVLQNEIVSLHEYSNRSSAALLEVQQQEALLKKSLTELEHKIKKCKSKNRAYRQILIVASVAAIVACTIFVPPLALGVAAGSEISVGLALFGDGAATLTLASAGTAAAGSAFVVSIKSKDKKVRNKNDMLPDFGRMELSGAEYFREERLEMIAANKAANLIASSLIEVPAAIIKKGVESLKLEVESLKHVASIACNSSPSALQHCQNIDAYYQKSKGFVNQSIEYVKDFSAEKVQDFCNSSLYSMRQCQDVEDFYTDFKKGFHLWIERRQDQIEKVAHDHEVQFGIPSELTLGLYSDAEQNAAALGMGLLGLGLGLAGKVIFPIKKANISASPSTFPKIPSTFPERRKLPFTLLPFERIAVSEEHYINRRVTAQPTKMVPEDIGISASEYLEANTSHPNSPFFIYDLQGWMIRKKGVLIIRIENLDLPEGRLNGFAVISNFKKIAKANGANVIEIEARIQNEKLLDAMKKRFGEPAIEIRKRYYIMQPYHIFTIPVEN